MRHAHGTSGQMPPPTLAAGSRDGTLSCLSAETGETLWTARTPHPLRALAHGGDIVYALSATEPRRIERRIVPPPPSGSPIRITFDFEPAELEARRASDGTLLWRKRDWQVAGWPLLALDGESILVASSFQAGDRSLFALDARTGAVRWTHPYDDRHLGPLAGHVIAQRFITARAGRVFLTIYEEQDSAPRISRLSGLLRLHVLDAATGAELWTAALTEGNVQVTDDGRTVTDRALRSTDLHSVTALDAADGSPVGTLTFPATSTYYGLSNARVAYIATGVGVDRVLEAVPVSTGVALWQADHTEAQSILTVGDHLLSTRHIVRDNSRHDALLEVAALDPRTGRRRWRWRTPESALDLLLLWGWRIPEMAGVIATRTLDSVEQMLDTALAANDARVFWHSARHELSAGQWRHPYAVRQEQVQADREAVYVGTRLGVFALSAKTGYPRWHALPAMEVELLAAAPVVGPDDVGQ